MTSDVWTPRSSKLLYSKSVVAWMQGNSARRHHFRFAHTSRVHGQMVKSLNKVKTQPGSSVVCEQRKIIEQLCVNKMSSQNSQLSCNGIRKGSCLCWTRWLFLQNEKKMLVQFVFVYHIKTKDDCFSTIVYNSSGVVLVCGKIVSLVSIFKFIDYIKYYIKK